MPAEIRTFLFGDVWAACLEGVVCFGESEEDAIRSVEEALALNK